MNRDKTEYIYATIIKGIAAARVTDVLSSLDLTLHDTQTIYYYTTTVLTNLLVRITQIMYTRYMAFFFLLFAILPLIIIIDGNKLMPRFIQSEAEKPFVLTRHDFRLRFRVNYDVYIFK